MATQEQSPQYKSLFPGYTIDGLPQIDGDLVRIHATQIALGRKVTILLLTPQASTCDNARQDFQKQIKTLSNLHHEHIPTVHNFGKIDNRLYAILTAIPTKSIAETTLNHPVDQTEAAHLIKKICLALQHAHQSEITHGNISPDTILLDRDANPTIPEFQNTPTDSSPYTAPEIQNHSQAPTPASDIYALGTLLYKLLTGQSPEDTNKPPSSFRDTDPRFDTIFVKATHRNPKLRYQTPEEMAADLEHIAFAINGKASSTLASFSSSTITKRHYAATPVRLAHPQKTAPVIVKKEPKKSAPKKLYGFVAALAVTATTVGFALSNHPAHITAQTAQQPTETIIEAPKAEIPSYVSIQKYTPKSTEAKQTVITRANQQEIIVCCQISHRHKLAR